jgi:hypothetical protein
MGLQSVCTFWREEIFLLLTGIASRSLRSSLYPVTAQPVSTYCTACIQLLQSLYPHTAQPVPSYCTACIHLLQSLYPHAASLYPLNAQPVTTYSTACINLLYSLYPLTAQPVSSYCTHYAIPAPIKSQKNWLIVDWVQRLLQMWIF